MHAAGSGHASPPAARRPSASSVTSPMPPPTHSRPGAGPAFRSWRGSASGLGADPPSRLGAGPAARAFKTVGGRAWQAGAMRFDTKIAIAVREDLAVWQKLNVTAFLAG